MIVRLSKLVRGMGPATRPGLFAGRGMIFYGLRDAALQKPRKYLGRREKQRDPRRILARFAK